MYRRPKFLEVLLEVRRSMSREADYDVDLFAEMVRTGKFPKNGYALGEDKKTDNKESEITNLKSEVRK